uniref:Uncharacterized protein n=1 Tax=Arundo donax TaxID=35708 RepID=A0A0A8XRH3_ARUDO
MINSLLCNYKTRTLSSCEFCGCLDTLNSQTPLDLGRGQGKAEKIANHTSVACYLWISIHS